jgi:hypothetical protein
MRSFLFKLTLVITAMTGVMTGGHPTVETASAQVPVDVALVLALDSSASVDAGEFALQRDGLAAAFRDPQVIQAIQNGPLKRIAVSVIEWAGEAQQQVDIGWSVIQSAADATAFADRVARLNRSIPTGATSIAGALSFANAHLRSAPVEATRKVIDLSGDGRNNQGMDVRIVRRAVIANGVTINALAILNEHPTLNYYYEDRVIGGVGAFVEIAENYADYREAINRKIIREIRSLSVSEGPATGERRTLSAMILPHERATLGPTVRAPTSGK